MYDIVQNELQRVIIVFMLLVAVVVAVVEFANNRCFRFVAVLRFTCCVFNLIVTVLSSIYILLLQQYRVHFRTR